MEGGDGVGVKKRLRQIKDAEAGSNSIPRLPIHGRGQRPPPRSYLDSLPTFGWPKDHSEILQDGRNHYRYERRLNWGWFAVGLRLATIV
jgi:hypothetical protein